MIDRYRLAPATLVVAAFAACAAPTPPGAAGVAFDGTYLGTTRLIGFSSPDWQCYWQAGPVVVAAGRLRADIDGAPMTVAIDADGKFDAWKNRNVYRQTRYMQMVHLVGHIAGGTLDATVHQPRCTLRLQLRRQ